MHKPYAIRRLIGILSLSFFLAAGDNQAKKGPIQNGIDTFAEMAKMGVYIVDRVVQEEMKGGVDLEKDVWYIPAVALDIQPGE